MAACNPGDNYEADASDCTICPWNTDVGYCVFLNHPVSITDIKSAQKCVHSDFTQDAITTCEKATSNKVPFCSLELTDFGHPRHGGVFACCTNAAGLLKNLVEKLPLLDDQNNEVDQNSYDAVNARCKTLEGQSTSRSNTVKFWSKDWHKDKLVEQRSQLEINKHTILITKCLGADKEFKAFYEVR